MEAFLIHGEGDYSLQQSDRFLVNPGRIAGFADYGSPLQNKNDTLSLDASLREKSAVNRIAVRSSLRLDRPSGVEQLIEVAMERQELAGFGAWSLRRLKRLRVIRRLVRSAA